MDRTASLRALVPPDSIGLEIGGSHSPIFPRSEGFNVDTLDHASAETLRAHYEPHGVDTSRIQDVDFVTDGRSIDDVVPHRAHYDFIFSSHAIEHVTDFIGHLQSCQRLLKPGGVVAMAVPDKRYTFDALRPVTTTGQVLKAHHQARNRHSSATHFDYIADVAALSGDLAWSRFSRGTLELLHDVASAKALFDEACSPDVPYHDLHAWVFTPASFRLLMHDLFAIGLVELRVATLHEEGALEFHVALSSRPTEPDRARLDIHHDLLREQVLAGMQLLAGGDRRMAAALTLLED